MASIGPEDYKIGQDMVKKFITEAEEYLNVNQAIIFKNENDNRVAAGNRIIGRLDVLIEGLEDHSTKREKWEQMRSDLEKIVERIGEY